jgi:hypothetical protein
VDEDAENSLAIGDEDTLNALESVIADTHPFPLPSMFNHIELGWAGCR